MLAKTVPISKARANIFKLVDETNSDHHPIIITGKTNDAVLLSLDDWNAIQETLYLTSIPDMKQSILKGLDTPIEECDTSLPW